jgi:chromosome segregation ATPase
MPTIVDKIKRCLASIEALRKDLTGLDEDHAAAEALARVLDGRRGELAEVEGRLARANAAFATADAEHSKWQQAVARERAKGNAEIDRLNAELQALDKEVGERRKESDNILQGIQALGRRLKV